MNSEKEHPTTSPIDKLVSFCLKNRLIVWLLLFALIAWGIMIAPFDWKLGDLPRDPVPVDAIPDIGENQQIVFTDWPGRSPQDVEDQITYPLSSALLALPGVKTLRAFSMFGFSSIYIIFDDDIDFYWSRSRILEKLNSLPSGTLPVGTIPALGPDATSLGQIFWYTIEGRDKQGNVTGGWDLQEIRTVQDWIVRYALLSAKGVSEVSSIGGYVNEYQVDVNPDALRAYHISLHDVFNAVRGSNLDVGARTIEINKVEYVIRGIGFIKKVKDLENTVLKVENDTPIFIKDVANVILGPALRRGVLNKDGAEVAGGVVVVRYGYNPLDAIKSTKEKINLIAPTLPKKTLPDGTVSQLTVVPFYDRTELIYETLNTLNEALILEILVTVIVILFMLKHLGSSIIISATLPLGVLVSFIFMKLFGVDANIVSLSGIAIAIGTMVYAGIVICENILKKLTEAKESRLRAVFTATTEVSGAVFTAIATTIVGFLPVFSMEAAEGKLFKPLAFTKTFAILSSALIAFTIVPVIAYYFLKPIPEKKRKKANIINWVVIILITVLLSIFWYPLGFEKGITRNLLFVGGILAGILTLFQIFRWVFPVLLKYALEYKKTFLSIPTALLLFGIFIWSGLGKEFLPPLDEGAFLFMPTTMPHASITEVSDVLAEQNIQISAIPEVREAVGKLGRVESPLDPAPLSMIETVIQYYPTFFTDPDQGVLYFAYDPLKIDYLKNIEGNLVLAPDGKPYKVRGSFKRDKQNKLIQDNNGMPFRLWRSPLDPEINPGRAYWAGIQKPEDIWNQIVTKSEIPGSTTSPMLQPIIARIVMLQSGMRAPMGIKIQGPTLEVIEKAGIAIEQILKKLPEIERDTVAADRIIAKPYLEIRIDREEIARYGIKVTDVQQVIEVAIGGKTITTTVEGRERYPVRVRYLRELRDQIEVLDDILVPSPLGSHIPLKQLADIVYVPGPQVIKSEDGFLVGYLTFDKKPQYAEVSVVNAAQKLINEKIASGELDLGENVSYIFAGNFENQIRAEKKLKLVVPTTLLIIFVILYFQFGSILTSLIVFSGILTAWSGGFIMIWLYGQPWFMDISIFGVNMRDFFMMHPINLSVAIWVGFLALFGIASDIGVLIAAGIDLGVKGREFKRVEELREAVIEASTRRIRPALMTSATTLLALLPVLTATGRGADIMVPMAIPSFGGMVIVLITIFIVPVLYCAKEEYRLRKIGQSRE
ncbi:MAG: Cation efflux system protein CusA [Chlamydiae bacterium]|nr:Cation efflux system protein CusA [Chlamydiota bacterium]